MENEESKEESIILLTWREAVRKRPAMYVGSTGFNGFIYLLKTIIQNLFFSTKSKYFQIEITENFNCKITFKKLQSLIKDSTNEDIRSGSYEFAVLNALCDKYKFILFDENDNLLVEQIYQKGILIKGKIEEIEFFADTLEIEFSFDYSIWNFNQTSILKLTDELRELAFLSPNKKFEIKYSENNEQTRIIYSFENGLFERLKLENNWADAKFTNHSKKDFGNFSIDFVFGLSPFSYDNKFIGSYVNFAETKDHGTHVIGLTKGLKKGLKAYLKKHLPKQKILITGSSIKKHLIAAIHVQIVKPTYWGPTKARLQNYEVIKPISEYVAETLLKELEKDSKSAEEFIKRFIYV